MSFWRFGLVAAVAHAQSLPRCIASNCGHAISFDGSGATRPLCLCNPLCQQMAGTPGVLPCCPGLQEVCLDPHRESPAPAPAPASVSLTASAGLGSSGAVLGASMNAVTRPAASSSFPPANSCVSKQLILAGDGVTFPKAGDTVSMHYTGALATTGAKFDSSKDRGKEFSTEIGVGRVIQGWDQGVPQMSLGEKAILRISATCGYGARGSPPDIPANSDLVFEVELLGLNGRRASVPSFAPAFGATALSPPAFAQAFPSPSFLPAATSAIPAALPTCRPNSCGKGMASGVNSQTAVCACDASCLAPGSSLPCCQSFREVCQNGLTSNSAVAPASQQFAQTFAPPAAKPTSLPAATSSTASCAIGKTPWAEQSSCDKKRWAIRNGQCKKTCPSVDASLGIKSYPTGTPGKESCAAALAACRY